MQILEIAVIVIVICCLYEIAASAAISSVRSAIVSPVDCIEAALHG